MGADSLQGHRQRFTDWRGYGATLPALAQAAPQAGFFNPLIDPDGLVRGVPLLAEFEGQVYESLVLAMFRELQGRPSVAPVFSDPWRSGGAPVLRGLRLQPAEGGAMAAAAVVASAGVASSSASQSNPTVSTASTTASAKEPCPPLAAANAAGS